MAIRNEFLCRNAQAIRFGNLDLAPSACTLASPLLPNSPLIFIAFSVLVRQFHARTREGVRQIAETVDAMWTVSASEMAFVSLVFAFSCGLGASMVNIT
jgi:hypothetical protein